MGQGRGILNNMHHKLKAELFSYKFWIKKKKKKAHIQLTDNTILPQKHIEKKEESNDSYCSVNYHLPLNATIQY